MIRKLGCALISALAPLVALAVFAMGVMMTGMMASLIPGQVSEVCENPDMLNNTGEQASAREATDEADDIPANMLTLYQEAAKKYGMDWVVLAGVGKAESDHGRDTATHQENGATAAGPMQFTRDTWTDFGRTPEGEASTNLDDRYDPEHAIHSAAHFLRSPPDVNTDLDAALLRYNPWPEYPGRVKQWMDVYGQGEFVTSDGSTTQSITTVTDIDLDQCPELESNAAQGGGVVAKAPDELTQEVVDWALAQRGKPYVWGGNGPDGYDCSGLVQGAYAAIGLNIPRVTHDQVTYGPRVDENDAQPGDLIFFNVGNNCGINCGPEPRHVGMVIDPKEKLMVEAWCTNCGPIATRTWSDRNVHAFTRPLGSEAGQQLSA